MPDHIRRPSTSTKSPASPVTGETSYVHLCSGEIVELHEVTALRVTDTAVIAMSGDKVLVAYPRRIVYFIADEPMEPPSLI